MKTTTMSCLAAAIALAASVNALAADMAKATMTRLYTDTVAPKDQVAYEAGVKAYNKCLGDHGFKYTWTALGHETGNVYTYSYVSAAGSWADFDKMHDGAKACDDAWRTQANPHIQSEYSAFLEAMPELSHTSKDMMSNAKLVHITFFTLKHGHDNHVAFTDAVKKLAAAAEKAKWPYYYTFQAVVDGDKGAADFVLANWSKSWAEFGADPNPAFWQMVEGVYGKDETASLRKTVNDATTDVNSHIDSVNADLTYTAAK
jgi:hypothetical protein